MSNKIKDGVITGLLLIDFIELLISKFKKGQQVVTTETIHEVIAELEARADANDEKMGINPE